MAATLACFVLLLAPALWNGYPLLQYATGRYLARWYEGYLVPTRYSDCFSTSGSACITEVRDMPNAAAERAPQGARTGKVKF
jgi:hypothetical protein